MLLLRRVALVDQLVDDPPEREQARVDHARLARAALHRAAPANVLGPGEVDEVELADLEDVLTLFRVVLNVHVDRED